jgi:hypothetical protein
VSEALYREAEADLDRVMARYALTEAERAALRSRDPRAVRQLGAHGMLALYVLRLDPEYKTNVYWTQK